MLGAGILIKPVFNLIKPIFNCAVEILHIFIFYQFYLSISL